MREKRNSQVCNRKKHSAETTFVWPERCALVTLEEKVEDEARIWQRTRGHGTERGYGSRVWSSGHAERGECR